MEMESADLAFFNATQSCELVFRELARLGIKEHEKWAADCVKSLRLCMIQIGGPLSLNSPLQWRALVNPHTREAIQLLQRLRLAVVNLKDLTKSRHPHNDFDAHCMLLTVQLHVDKGGEFGEFFLWRKERRAVSASLHAADIYPQPVLQCREEIEGMINQISSLVNTACTPRTPAQFEDADRSFHKKSKSQQSNVKALLRHVTSRFRVGEIEGRLKECNNKRQNRFAHARSNMAPPKWLRLDNDEAGYPSPPSLPKNVDEFVCPACYGTFPRLILDTAIWR